MPKTLMDVEDLRRMIDGAVFPLRDVHLLCGSFITQPDCISSSSSSASSFLLLSAPRIGSSLAAKSANLAVVVFSFECHLADLAVSGCRGNCPTPSASVHSRSLPVSLSDNPDGPGGRTDEWRDSHCGNRGLEEGLSVKIIAGLTICPLSL